MTWQPIETAPKDGTGVLVYEPDGAISVMWWDHGEDDWRGGFDIDDGRPTHWMPLPEPPS